MQPSTVPPSSFQQRIDATWNRLSSPAADAALDKVGGAQAKLRDVLEADPLVTANRAANRGMITGDPAVEPQTVTKVHGALGDLVKSAVDVTSSLQVPERSSLGFALSETATEARSAQRLLTTSGASTWRTISDALMPLTDNQRTNLDMSRGFDVDALSGASKALQGVEGATPETAREAAQQLAGTRDRIADSYAYLEPAVELLREHRAAIGDGRPGPWFQHGSHEHEVLSGAVAKARDGLRLQDPARHPNSVADVEREIAAGMYKLESAVGDPRMSGTAAAYDLDQIAPALIETRTKMDDAFTGVVKERGDLLNTAGALGRDPKHREPVVEWKDLASMQSVADHMESHRH